MVNFIGADKSEEVVIGLDGSPPVDIFSSIRPRGTWGKHHPQKLAMVVMSWSISLDIPA